MTQSGPISVTVAGVSARSAAARRYGMILAAVLGVALILRIAILIEYLAKNPTAEEPYQDAQTYWEWAGRIAAGQWSEATPFLAAPLYPYLLGLLRMLGGGLVAVYAAQIILHIATAGVIAGATRLRFGATAALLAAVFYCALTEPASFALRALPNTLQLFLVALLWRLLAPIGGSVSAKSAVLRDSKSPSAPEGRVSLPRAIGVGVTLGALALAMPQAQLLIPLVVGWLWIVAKAASREKRLAPALALLVALVVIAPATLHNYRASGEFIPITAHSGITMRQGNSPVGVAQGIYVTVAGISANRSRMHEDAARVFAEQNGRPGSWAEIDAFFRNQVFAWWQSKPAAAVELFIKKAWWFLTARNYDDQFPPVMECEFGMADRMWLAPLPTPWLIGAAAAGLVSVLRTPRRRGVEWMFIAVALLTTLIFFYTPRYRLCALPPLCGFAAYAVAKIRRLQIPSYVALTLMLAPAGGELLNQTVFEIDTGRRYVKFDSPDLLRGTYGPVLSMCHARAGDRRLAAGDLADAERWYSRALEIDQEAAVKSKLEAPPARNAVALRQLGAIRLERGDAEGGAKLIEESLIFDPQHAPSYLRMYNVLMTRAKPIPAADFLSRAIELDPNNADALLARAWLAATTEVVVLRNFLTAQELAQRAIDAAGPAEVAKHPDYYDVLAAAYASADRYDDAVRTAEKALAIARQTNDAKYAAAIEQRIAQYREKEIWRGPPRPVRVPLTP